MKDVNNFVEEMKVEVVFVTGNGWKRYFQKVDIWYTLWLKAVSRWGGETEGSQV